MLSLDEIRKINERENEIRQDNPEWNRAQKFVDEADDPPDYITRQITPMSMSTVHGNQKHEIKKFIYKTEVNGFDAEMIWGVCIQCNEVKYKHWAVFNMQTNSCYLREIIKGGKVV